VDASGDVRFRPVATVEEMLADVLIASRRPEFCPGFASLPSCVRPEFFADDEGFLRGCIRGILPVLRRTGPFGAR